MSTVIHCRLLLVRMHQPTRFLCKYKTIRCLRWSSLASRLPTMPDKIYENQPARVQNCFQMFDWLSEHSRGFLVDGNKIRVIQEPREFYDTILEKITKAKRRVTLAALYLGTAELEQELVRHLQSALKQSNGLLEMTCLLDYTRGLRGMTNSCTRLRPLLKYPKVQVALYHTPYLRGFLKAVVPDRWNELIGLQHMKVSIFDDSILISGANLSNDYFVNRQDRYVLMEDCPKLAEYLHNIVSAVASLSLQLQQDGSMKLHPSWDLHPFESVKEHFQEKARERILSSLTYQQNLTNKTDFEREQGDTIVYPLIQMSDFGIKQDEEVTVELLRRAVQGSRIIVSSGYFNLTDIYKKIILQESHATIRIITASPEANGFHGARGVAGAIPSAYTQLASLFHKHIFQQQQQHRVHLLEFSKPGWTFHAKGLWYYLPNEELPTSTAIGSPNFGFRSANRDLEMQLIVITENLNLRKELKKEQINICEKSVPVTDQTFLHPERKVPMWVKLVSRFFVQYF